MRINQSKCGNSLWIEGIERNTQATRRVEVVQTSLCFLFPSPTKALATSAVGFGLKKIAKTGRNGRRDTESEREKKRREKEKEDRSRRSD